MTLEEVIAQHRANAETDSGLALVDIDATLSWLKERLRVAALTSLRSEIQAVLDEQALATWLVNNSIPESMWGDYSYSNGVLTYQGVTVNG